MVRVFNLATQQELFYWLAPALAVVAAYAQERKDFNTWGYMKYWDLLEYSPRVVTCGDWSAIHTAVRS
jgi:hypothetical protein